MIEGNFLASGFLLEDWEIRPLAGIAEKNNHGIHLEPKVMDVLVCLARHQGEVVTRDILLKEVWGNIIVSDDAMTRCISELRSVFGDTNRERSYIRTIPRRGYSLLIPVTPMDIKNNNGAQGANGYIPSSGQNIVSNPSQSVPDRRIKITPWFELCFCPPSIPESVSGQKIKIAILASLLFAAVLPIMFFILKDNLQSPLSSPEQSAPQGQTGETKEEIRALAVLPFVSLSADEDHEYFADGLSEDIRSTLMMLSEVRIAARTSSTAFKNIPMDVRKIASQLQVDALLEGTVRINNGRIRVTAQLTHGGSGYSIWAASYEYDLEDKIQLQTEIAKEITGQLMPSFQTDNGRPKGTTLNVQANDYYFLGRHHWHKRTAESLILAEDYFRKALALDPGYALAHSGLADTLIFQISYGTRQLSDIQVEAEAEIERALELEPDLAEAHASRGLLMENLGAHNDSLHSYQRAVDLKPQYSMAQMWLGNSWGGEGNVHQAHHHYSEALKIDPLHPKIQFNYALSLMRLGRQDEALQELEKFRAQNADDEFLKLQMEIKLSLGLYNEVLDLAVNHTFTGDYKPYTDGTLIKALIQLQRFDEAQRMIEENSEQMDDYLYALLRSELAIARRDYAELQSVITFIESPEFKSKHMAKKRCAEIESMPVYYSAVAAYMVGDFTEADIKFDELRKIDLPDYCRSMNPEYDISISLYHAQSKLRMNRNDPSALDIIKQSNDRLAHARTMGWDTPSLAGMEILLDYHNGNKSAAISKLTQMIEHGWLPLGLMQSSPLFDDFLNSGDMGSEIALLNSGYQSVQEECGKIGLSKLGL